MAPTKKRKSYYTSGADDCLEEGETRLGGDDGPARKKKKKKKEPPPKKKKLSVKPAMSKKDKRKLAKRKFAALSPQAAAESQRVAKAVSEAKAAATIWPSKGKTKEGHTWSSTKEGGRVRVFDKPPEGWVGSNNRALREHPDYRNSNAGIYSAARFVKTRENTLAPGAPLDKTWESKGTVRVDGHRRPVDYSGFVRGVHDLRHIEGMHQSAGPPLEAHPDYIRWIKHLYGGSTGDETGKLACGATWRGYTPVDANVRDFRGSESDPGSRNDWHGARGRPLEGHPDYDKSATAICSRDREYPRCCHNRIAEFCFECGAPTAYRFAIRAGIDSDCGKVSCTELTGFSAGDVERILGARKVAFTEEQFDFMTTETRPSPIGNANWHVEELDHISPVHLLGGEMGLTPGGRPNKWAKIANR